MAFMKSCVALVLASLVCGEPLCEQIKKILGSDCRITDPGICLNVLCNLNLAHVEDVQVNIDLSGVCNTTIPQVQFDFREKDLAIHFRKIVDISPVENRYFPVPGLNIKIPILGTAGVYGVTTLAGNKSVLKLDLGVDACLTTSGKKNALECGSKVSSDLPVWILRGSINATEGCDGPIPAPTPSPTLPPPTPAETTECLTCINHKSKIIGHDKDWCWVDKVCHDTGSVENPCFPETCVSNDHLSKCSASKTCKIA